MNTFSNGGCKYNDHENGFPSTYLNSNGVPSDSVSTNLLDNNQGDTSLSEIY